MTDRPKVSLIMPNYNYAKYLPDSLKGVIEQTYRSFELIFIEDASTDNSLEILKPYLEKYPFIHLIQHKTNQGLFKSVQKGLDRAQGEYVSLTSSDDFLFPQFLEKNVRALEENPDIGLSFSMAATFNSEEPQKLIVTELQKSYPEMKLSQKELIYQIKMHRLWIPGNTVLCRKKFFIQYGGNDPQYASLTDWFAFLKMGFKEGAYFLPEILAALRVHPNSFSSTETLEKKQRVWALMIENLSQKENKPLKKAFIRSHIFNTFGYPFFDYILKNPQFWPFFQLYVYKHFFKRWKKERKKQKISA